MKAADIPTKFPIPFAENAGGTYSRVVPETTTDANAASLDLGFPPNTFTPEGAGGAPPDGRDFNGILNQISAWNQWASAGGPLKYDATFSTNIGGYPKGAIIASATNFGIFWYSTEDDNTTDPDVSGAGWTGFQLGQNPGVGSRLSYASAVAVQLDPYTGGLLWINGVNYVVPAGLQLSNAGLAAATVYFIYAYISGSAMTLEASATGYTAASNGIPQKAGDATRTLVGMVRTNGSSQFVYSSAQRFVASYFNRRMITGGSANVATIGRTNAALGELTTSARGEFLAWADEGIMLGLVTNVQSTDVGTPSTCIAADGAQVNGALSTYAATGSLISNGSQGTFWSAADGYHYVTAFGASGNNAILATWTNLSTSFATRL